jgi:DNA-binding transcriptional regulator YiaG
MPAHIRAARRDIRALQKVIARLVDDVADLFAARRREMPVPPAPEEELENVRFTKRTPKSLRERFDLTQEELAKLLQVSPVTITSWETGKSRPRKANLAQIVTLRNMEQAQVDAALSREQAPAAVKPQQLKRLRRKLSLTQSELAKLLGVSTASITSWEAGKAEPGRDNRRLIAQLKKLSRREAEERLGRRGAARGRAAGKDEPLLSPSEINAIRKKAGLSQTRLAKLLKVSANSVSNWETGRSSPRRATAEKLLGLRKGT